MSLNLPPFQVNMRHTPIPDVEPFAIGGGIAVLIGLDNPQGPRFDLNVAWRHEDGEEDEWMIIKHGPTGVSNIWALWANSSNSYRHVDGQLITGTFEEIVYAVGAGIVLDYQQQVNDEWLDPWFEIVDPQSGNGAPTLPTSAKGVVYAALKKWFLDARKVKVK